MKEHVLSYTLTQDQYSFVMGLLRFQDSNGQLTKTQYAAYLRFLKYIETYAYKRVGIFTKE